tara:strand:+ start:682 stop:1353 length:672 start_codon:yes stop_codon:yes gene_type:complete
MTITVFNQKMSGTFIIKALCLATVLIYISKTYLSMNSGIWMIIIGIIIYVYYYSSFNVEKTQSKLINKVVKELHLTNVPLLANDSYLLLLIVKLYNLLTIAKHGKQSTVKHQLQNLLHKLYIYKQLLQTATTKKYQASYLYQNSHKMAHEIIHSIQSYQYRISFSEETNYKKLQQTIHALTQYVKTELTTIQKHIQQSWFENPVTCNSTPLDNTMMAYNDGLQ